MDEQSIRDKLTKPFPPEAIKTRQGGRGSALSYLAGHTVINRLNAACPAWNFEILREWQEGDRLKAHVRLTIPGLGAREHIGVQLISGRPGSEDMESKGHVTDALKKAASLFGVGIELYGDDYESADYVDRSTGEIRDQRPQETAPQRPPGPRVMQQTGGTSYEQATGRAVPDEPCMIDGCQNVCAGAFVGFSKRTYGVALCAKHSALAKRGELNGALEQALLLESSAAADYDRLGN